MVEVASGSCLFLQRDPFGYEDSVNLYAGLANDPINHRDPTGALTTEEIKAIRARLVSQTAALLELQRGLRLLIDRYPADRGLLTTRQFFALDALIALDQQVIPGQLAQARSQYDQLEGAVGITAQQFFERNPDFWGSQFNTLAFTAGPIEWFAGALADEGAGRLGIDDPVVRAIIVAVAGGVAGFAKGEIVSLLSSQSGGTGVALGELSLVREPTGGLSMIARGGVSGAPGELEGPVTFGANFAKKIRKHIDQVRNRFAVREAIPEPSRGGADAIERIIRARVGKGGGVLKTYAGESAIFFDDGAVVYVIRPDGEFWTILRNTEAL